MRYLYLFTTFCLVFSTNYLFAQPCSVGAGDLVITEFMPDPTGSDSDREYFEIYNATAADIDLRGVQIKDAGSNNHTISGTDPVTIAAGAYFVLGRSDVAVDNGGLPVDYVITSSFSLVNSEDEIILECEGTEIDRIEYSSMNIFPFGKGVSTELAPNQLAANNNDPANWCAAATPYGTLEPQDLGTPGEVGVICSCPPTGSLVITEIMSNPTGSESDREYFELYNTSTFQINLGTTTNPLVVRDNNTSGNPVNNNLIIQPNEYLVFGREADMTLNGNVEVDFVISFVLSNAADQIILTCGGIEVERVDYDDAFPTGEGASMNLDPGSLNSTDNDSGENWCASTSPIVGGDDAGTPGSANDACSALAVDLLHFSAKAQTDIIQLNWQTANEIDHDYFIIERSKDGILFNEIGRATGKNLGQQRASYEFVDNNPLSGTNVYRLRTVDFTQKTTLSNLIFVNFTATTDLIIYPNPVTDQLNLSGNISTTSYYQINDQYGRILRSNPLTHPTVDVNELPAGVYFITIGNKNARTTQRFIKK